jgi:hypothetical protein
MRFDSAGDQGAAFSERLAFFYTIHAHLSGQPISTRERRAAYSRNGDTRTEGRPPKYSHGDVWPATRAQAILRQRGTDMLINKIHVDQVALA